MLYWSFGKHVTLLGSVLCPVGFAVRMSDQTMEYFFTRSRIRKRDAAEVRWSHAVNSRSRLNEALTGPNHMIEADVIIRGRDPREPIMAHPPDTDSDITLKEWLEGLKYSDKGIKLDFKSLEAVSPSVVLLEEAYRLNRPVWINADILSGPGGQARPLEPQAFLSSVKSLPPHTVLSLGWTTGWTAGTGNAGYSWDMVRVMQETCRALQHPVTFPVRAALLAQSFSQLSWLLQQSDSYIYLLLVYLRGTTTCIGQRSKLQYTLTVWTGQNDKVTLQDLLPYKEEFDISRIYYDLEDSGRTELSITLQDNN